MLAIVISDTVLIASKDFVHDAQKALELLGSTDSAHAMAFPKYDQSRGWSKSLVLCEFFRVMRICVKPGMALSL